MLELREITKAYRTASLTQTALDGVSVAFRDNEFVAILGQSGSGKTTMLNVVGGLDHFDSGDLVIDGISTRDFKDRDWDAYRNNRIGFVFQAYNLIPHQTVLANVELALTLSGISRSERRERALAVLEDVGLKDHVSKRPNQLSGGQMQRVAIARALINDPEILLADEPTGALDSATSIQVMDLLREVAKDRLVVMVTHNPELAHQYATRIVELADGHIISDSDPFVPGALTRAAKAARRTRMSLVTALSLSFNNLMTKKGRTIMTSFAGSIGIIGIALILALANGVNGYIARTEEEALTSYPLSIQRAGVNLEGMLTQTSSAQAADGEVLMVRERAEALTATRSNDLRALRTFLEGPSAGVQNYVRAIEYSYNATPQIYLRDTSDGVVRVHPDQASSAMSENFGQSAFGSMMDTSVFHQMPSNPELYRDQFTVSAGRWPESSDEMVLVTRKDGTVDSLLEYSLGLRPYSEFSAMYSAFMSGQTSSIVGGASASPSPSASPTDSSSSSSMTSAAASASPSEGVDSPVVETGLATDGAASANGSLDGSASDSQAFSYDQILGREFSLVPASARYQHDAERGVWTDRSEQDDYMKRAVEQGRTLRIVGIVRATDDTTTLPSGIAYTADLTREVIEEAAASPIVQAQRANPDVDVFTGQRFSDLAAGQRSELDLSSIFSIDGEALQAAFQMDPAALEMDLSSLDFSSISLPSDMQSLDLSSIGLSGLDLSALSGALDPSDFDLSAIAGTLNLADLAAQYPQLAEIDVAAVLEKALESGAIQEGAGTYLAGVGAQLMEGFFTYAQANPPTAGSVEDWAGVVRSYLATDAVREQLEQAANSDQVINRAALTSALVTALGEDPAMTTVSEQLSQAVGQQIASQLAAQLSSQLGSGVAQSVGTALSQAIGGSMTQMMMSLQQQIEGQLSQVVSALQSGLANAFHVDEAALQEAFTPEMDQEELAALLATMMTRSVPSYEGNLQQLGWADLDTPSQIDLYPTSFADKDAVEQILSDYNARAEAAGHSEQVITYTDLVGTLMSSVTRIVNVITWMLIAFVAISLVVSSIMIAIITYISVLERKKEIGILRAIGASKGDVRRVFNAETIIEGLMAGLMGVGATLLLSIPANLIAQSRFNVYPIASLPVTAGIVLVLLSVALTVIAGIIPSRQASKADPVEALRSE